jgi:hypothetical protein
MVGASREMVSRVVKDLIGNEVVRRRKRKLIVLDRNALAARASFRGAATALSPADGAGTMPAQA